MDEAARRYGKGISIDAIGEAMECATLDEAVHLVLLETVMWDSTKGDPSDPEIWATILPVKPL
jgi:hypothetical protein